MDAVKISMSGLDVEWKRLQVIAENLANMNTTRDAAGGTYAPRRLVSGPAASFAELVSAGAEGRAPGLAPGGVRVMGVEQTGTPARRAFEPNHPHADPDGFVSYPSVDHAGEMTLMIRTSRAYEANLTAMSLAQQMYGRALEMGRQS